MNAKVLPILLISILLVIGKAYTQDYNLAYHAASPSASEKKAATSNNSSPSYRWEFSDTSTSDFNTPEFAQIEEHDMGKEVACLRYLVDKSYIQRENPIPGDPTTRILIKKQNIYDALRNIEKYYKKQAKKQLITQEEVARQYSAILKVSIAAMYEENTKSFEEALSQEKKAPEKQIALFKQVKLVSIY